MLVRTRYAPTFPSLFNELDALLRDFSAPVSVDETTPSVRGLVPAADIAETEKSVEIHLDMPGVKADDIDVKLEGNVLTITAERKAEATTEKKGWIRQERSFGRFTRSFTLPAALEGTTPEAAYRNGVLTLSLPKKEEVLPKTVKVKVEA